jgi:flagellar hook-basal body complex protein FliE
MQIATSLASMGYDRARIAANPLDAGALSFGQSAPNRVEARLAAGIGSFAHSLQQTDHAALASLVTGADPHALVEAVAATELAVEAAVAVRNRVVEAYLEILRMPV